MRLSIIGLNSVLYIKTAYLTLWKVDGSSWLLPDKWIHIWAPNGQCTLLNGSSALYEWVLQHIIVPFNNKEHNCLLKVLDFTVTNNNNTWLALTLYNMQLRSNRKLFSISQEKNYTNMYLLVVIYFNYKFSNPINHEEQCWGVSSDPLLSAVQVGYFRKAHTGIKPREAPVVQGQFC